MLFMVCSVILATGAWNCGDPKNAAPLEQAASMVYAMNSQYVWKPGGAESPYTIWPADKPTPDKQ